MASQQLCFGVLVVTTILTIAVIGVFLQQNYDGTIKKVKV